MQVLPGTMHEPLSTEVDARFAYCPDVSKCAPGVTDGPDVLHDKLTNFACYGEPAL